MMIIYGNINAATPVPAGLTVITLTEAAAQARAIAGTLNPQTEIYLITDAGNTTFGGGVSCALLIQAYSSTQMMNSGSGIFTNAVMATPTFVFVTYNLTTGKFGSIYEPVRNNYLFSDNAGSLDFAIFPFDNGLFTDNFLYNANMTVLNAQIFVSNTIYTSQISIDNSSVFSSNLIYSATIDIGGISACNITGCNIYQGATLVGRDNINLNTCLIGENKTVSMTGVPNYTATGKVIQGKTSTFEIRSTDSAAVNPDGGNKIDMIDFSFAGILIPDDNSNSLSTFKDYPLDHSFIYAPNANAYIVNDSASLLGGNILLPVTGSTPTLNGSNEDFLEFEAGKNHPGIVHQISGIIRV